MCIRDIFRPGVWVAAGSAVFLPATTSTVADLFGVGRGVDLVVYVSIIALFYLVFRIYDKVERVENDVTRLVREDAVNDGGNKDG